MFSALLEASSDEDYTALRVSGSMPAFCGSLLLEKGRKAILNLLTSFLSSLICPATSAPSRPRTLGLNSACSGGQIDFSASVARPQS